MMSDIGPLLAVGYSETWPQRQSQLISAQQWEWLTETRSPKVALIPLVCPRRVSSRLNKSQWDVPPLFRRPSGFPVTGPACVRRPVLRILEPSLSPALSHCEARFTKSGLSCAFLRNTRPKSPVISFPKKELSPTNASTENYFSLHSVSGSVWCPRCDLIIISSVWLRLKNNNVWCNGKARTLTRCWGCGTSPGHG